MKFFKSDSKLKTAGYWALFAVASGALLFTLFFFVRDLTGMNLGQQLRAWRESRKSLRSSLFARKHPLQPNEISGWMTFRYIDFVFNLSPDYLKSQLAISDWRYPNLTVNAYAKSAKLSEAEALAKVSEAIKQHQSGQKGPGQ